MEHHAPAPHTPRKSQTTPKDFFLWLGAIIGLYGAITSFFTLIFHYIDLAFPDPLAYTIDPLNTGTRVAMATIIVLVPIFLGLLLTIRRGIVREPGKADIWVRRWALVLTVFLSGAIAAIDLITLLTTFLGGDLTTRFALKAIVVLLLSILTCLHFLADYWGYWTLHRRKVDMVGAAVGALALMTVIAGFWLIGSPSHMRALRYDQQRVNDLQGIQYQIVNYWQQKRALPPSLVALNDPLQGYSVPVEPGSGVPYEYKAESAFSFTLCSTFEAPSGVVSRGEDISYPSGSGMEQSFSHGVGRTCYTRTIDPDKYPAAPKPL